MKQHFLRLWRGEIALARVFWWYAIAYGALLNLLFTILAFAVVASDGPPLLSVAAFLLPLPYNVFVVICVWRSAAHYGGNARWADAARIASVAWSMLLTLV
jgi:hypothetical protein